MSKFTLAIWVTLAVIALLAAGGLMFMLTFNHGVVPLVAACGGAVTKISFWTAFFAAWFVQGVASLVGASISTSK